MARQRQTFIPRSNSSEEVVPAKVDTDAFARGKLLSRVERELGKENTDAVLFATGGQGLSEGVSLSDDKEDVAAFRVNYVVKGVEGRALAYGRTATPIHYMNALFGNPQAKKPRGPNRMACAAITDLITVKLSKKKSPEDGVTIDFRVDGNTLLARVLHDALFYAGEILPPSLASEWENTPCQIRFLGGSTVTEPVELGSWTQESTTDIETTDIQNTVVDDESADEFEEEDLAPPEEVDYEEEDEGSAERTADPDQGIVTG